MTLCTKCNGSGLTGAGDEPWMHRGAVTTCADCKGTGTLPDAPTEESVDVPTPPAEKSFFGRALDSIGL